ncbi:P-loop NTPase fold protein [Phascolarctobacterium sp.]
MISSQNNIVDRIKVYIDESMSDYAIMLNGGWGSGKTYFVKNNLIPSLENNKSVIYISLFGVKSLEDLINIISIHVFNIYSNERAYKKAGFNNNVFEQKKFSSNSKGISNFVGLVSKGLNLIPRGEDAKRFVNCLQKNSINFSRYVFIFDDFERSIINKIELLGFFDELVEQNNSKVIIVCNENKIISTEEDVSNVENEENNNVDSNKTLVDDYKLYKEKVVGLTIKHETDLSCSYKTVLDKELSGDECYSFLLSHRENVLELFDRVASHNLRTLIFIIRRFKELNKKIKDAFKKHNKNQDFFHGYMLQILLNLVAVSIEYKDLGKGLVVIPEDKDTLIKFFSRDGFKNNTEGDIESYIRITRFINIYIHDYFLNEDLLIKDINRYILEAENDTQLISVEINNIFCIEQDERAVQELDLILKNIKDNKYSLGVYPRILSNLFILMSIFYNDIKQLHELKKDILKNAIDRADEFSENNWFYFSSSNVDANKFNNLIYKKLKCIRKDILKSRYITAFSKEDEFTGIFRKLVERGDGDVKKGRSLLSYIPVELIVKRVTETSNDNIQIIHGILRYNYLNVTNIKDIRHGDLCMFTRWRDLMDEQMDNISSRLKCFHLKILLTCIGEICNRLK